MNDLRQFIAEYGSCEPLVILVEGRRSIPAEWERRAEQLGARLARELPKAIFRTGNADGSDTAFAAGVGAFDPARLEYVVPYQSHKTKNRIDGAKVMTMESQDQARAREVVDLSVTATPNNKKLLVSYGAVARDQLKGWEKSRFAKAELLLRDALKVTGSGDSGYAPATVALFYIDPADPEGGGTGHTIRCCRERGVPVYTQESWQHWSDQLGEMKPRMDE